LENEARGDAKKFDKKFVGVRKESFIRGTKNLEPERRHFGRKGGAGEGMN